MQKKENKHNHAILSLFSHLFLPETINERTLENDRPRVFEAIQT